MKIQTSINQELLDLLNQVEVSYDELNFEVTISQVKHILSAMDLSQDQKDAFIYYQAAALDTSQKHLEALPLFLGLLERDPACQYKLNSVKLVCKNIAGVAASTMEKKPDAKELENYENILLQFSNAPSWLRLHLAKRKAAQGEAEAAKKICKNYLFLSPNDGDFLKVALEVAKVIQDQAWLLELKQTIMRRSEVQPYRMDLIALLDQFEMKSAVA